MEESFKNLEKETKVFYSVSRGPGGQRRDRKKTGIKLLHLPSGIIVASDRLRSQAQNRKRAFELLRTKLKNLRKPRKKRILTRIPRRAREKRLQSKKMRSFKKRLRKSALTEG